MSNLSIPNSDNIYYSKINEGTLYKETLINGTPPKAVNIPTTVIGIDSNGNIYEEQFKSYAYEIVGD